MRRKNNLRNYITKVIRDSQSKKKYVDTYFYCEYDENISGKFYKFLGVTFHIYEMNTPIGKSNELPDHYKQGSNEKALIKYENYDDYLCFWRCLSYHQTKPEDPRNVNKKMKAIFNEYYNKEKDIKNCNGVEYVAYDKKYTDEALDNEEYDKRMMK